MEWDNVSWFQHDWVWEAGGVILVLALIGTIVWFIDGIRQYAYWRKDDDEEKGDNE